MPRRKRKYGRYKLRLLSYKQENDGNISYMFFAKIGIMLQEIQEVIVKDKLGARRRNNL